MALFRLREYDEAFREVFSRVIRARAEEAYPLLKEIPTEPRPTVHTSQVHHVQYVFQSKAGDLNLGDWSKGTPQLDLLRTNTLAHPGFDAALPRRPVLVLTGRLTGGAALAAQNYCEQARASGIGLEM